MSAHCSLFPRGIHHQVISKKRGACFWANVNFHCGLRGNVSTYHLNTDNIASMVGNDAGSKTDAFCQTTTVIRESTVEPQCRICVLFFPPTFTLYFLVPCKTYPCMNTKPPVATVYMTCMREKARFGSTMSTPSAFNAAAKIVSKL
jgi:hypothetical protein